MPIHLQKRPLLSTVRICQSNAHHKSNHFHFLFLNVPFLLLFFFVPVEQDAKLNIIVGVCVRACVRACERACVRLNVLLPLLTT